MNLDGSDAAAGFSLPRIEIRSTSEGWRTDCYLLDGTRHGFGGGYLGGLAAAKLAALADARKLLGPEVAGALKTAGL
jgi:hypothetical protein